MVTSGLALRREFICSRGTTQRRSACECAGHAALCRTLKYTLNNELTTATVAHFLEHITACLSCVTTLNAR
jgi:hypothetical protein